MLFIDVAYKDKEKAKSLGARWNPAKKSWYVSNSKDYTKFSRWIIPKGNLVVCDYLFVIEWINKCWKCGQYTRVIALGAKSFYSFEYDDNHYYSEYLSDAIRIINTYDKLPVDILGFIQSNYNYKIRTSKTTQIQAYNCCCDHCNSLQGRHYLYEEEDSPFFIMTVEKAKKLTVYKIPLECDLIITGDYAVGSDDGLIDMYANINEIFV